jgi:3-hydroxyisobutyrate dehydrogenase
MTKTSIAFLGLGIMGTGIVRRLLSHGFAVKVWNRNLDKAQALKSDGATVAQSPREAASGAQIVWAMLADDAASRSVWTGENGALASAKPGMILVESSTLSVGWVRELAAMAKEKGCTFVDAPVAGSKPQAAAGELNFFVGADGAIPESLMPALKATGKNITHFGPVGSGAMIKLINNFVCGIQLVAIAEGIALLERTDLDKEKALNWLANGTPASPMVKNLIPRMNSRDYTPNFLLKLMAKDMAYAIAEGKARSLDLTTAARALDVMKQAIPKHGEQDLSSVVELYREQK